ncbi:MAG TPA: NFACT family protein [Blastocatellia bacterium]|jgi:predicted ribosome quality control (RQC) complex YloA/Tae2 family protein|nr:NFACT family protein [Blastocatellia bacterium]
MDNFLLQIIVNELGLRLGGHRIGGIYQIGATDLAIDFYAPNERWLMISTDPQRLAFFLTARNPKQGRDELRSDTAFVALARKHLGGSRLATAEKLGYDRVAHLEFNVKDKDGKTTRRKLVVALTGRSANVLLTEDSRIIASLRERDETITQYVDPAPPTDKIDPFLCSAEKLDELIAGASGDIAEAARRLIGFSPIYARELAHRAQRETPGEALRGLLSDLCESPPSPTIYSPLTAPAGAADTVGAAGMDELKRDIGRDDFDLVLSPIKLESLSDRGAVRFAGVIEAADAYFALLDERRRLFALKRKLRSHLLSQLRQRRDLLNHLSRDLDKFSNGELHRRYGELLLANLRQAVKTGGGFLVTDFYDEAQPLIEIPSAGVPTPQEAAEHYFKLARKARRGFEKVSDRLPQVENEIAQLEKHLAGLDAGAGADALNSLAAQLNLPAPEKKPSQPAKKEEKIPGVRRYRSSDGYEIMVGRAGADNDHLTFRVAKSYDLWFHAADYPGSHVVLRNPQRKSVPPRAITEAAQLAAKFSQARTLPRAAVNYCERKYVTKMKGFAPGQVRLSSFKTVMVEPGEAGERLD